MPRSTRLRPRSGAAHTMLGLQSAQYQGFALPLAMGLGFVMLTLSATLILVSQGGLMSARQRRGSGVSFAMAEGGVSRVLAHLTQRDNAILLGRNYDTINPETGKTYLGTDGVPNSGDEDDTLVDEWSNYDPSGLPCFQVRGVGAPTLATTGAMGDGSYTIRAYRYDPSRSVGTLLIEGNQRDRSSAILISLSVKPDLEAFPGVIASRNTRDAEKTGVVALRGRKILGSKGHVYFAPSSSPNPSLIGLAAPGDRDRSNYLDSIWSNRTRDGATSDPVPGEVAGCTLQAWLPSRVRGTNLGVIDSDTTLTGVGGTAPTLYQVEAIDLENNEILTVDTTNGSVYLDFIDKGIDPQFSITLRDTAKILHRRSDGQAPRVGDFRIMGDYHNLVRLYDRTCIQGAFLWIPIDELHLFGSGPGCPGGKNTNFEGVVWAEAILSSKNNASNHNIRYLDRVGTPNSEYDRLVTAGATSGIAVSEDVSSLIDALQYLEDWPARYRFKGVLRWQRVQL